MTQPLTDHERSRLERAIALARKGCLDVEPNPPVGCVLEREGTVIGEGWHKAYGGPHAEIEALKLVHRRAEGATAYISLQPCSRTGKTGPCCDALLKAGVQRVIYASRDPLEDKASPGLHKLKKGGVEVLGPALPELGDTLLKRFIAHTHIERPWVILKWAMTLDGRIAPREGEGGTIAGRRSRLLSHIWRGRVDAIAVGIGTILSDDPELTCRVEGGPPDGRPQPARVIFDRLLTTPLDAKILQTVDKAPVWIVTGTGAPEKLEAALAGRGAKILRVRHGAGGLDMSAVLSSLYQEGIGRLLVEGGARIHGTFVRQKLADQACAFVAPVIAGGEQAVPAIRGSGINDMAHALQLEDVRWRGLGDDVLVRGYMPRTTRRPYARGAPPK